MRHNEIKEALNKAGVQSQQARKYLAAKLAFKQALTFEPDNVVLLANLGAMHHELFEFDEAIACFEKALKLNPEHPATHGNYGLLLNTVNKHDEANDHFLKALEAEPENTLGHWNYALNLLDSGNWEQGFKEYEWRMRHVPIDYPKYRFPLWNGEDLTDKTIVVYEEQGIGDRILFSRFIFQLKQKYPTCKIHFMCGHQTMPLLWEYQKHGICEFLPINVIFPEADYGVFLLSLPRILGCTDPNSVPPDPGFIKDRCEFQKKTLQFNTLVPNGKRVGLCWHGSYTHAQDHMRSIPFEKLMPLVDNPYYTWYSLQVEPDSADIKKFGMEELVHDCSERINKDWVKTGVILLNLDLVITVDTAVAHLAGALGVPVWLLVPKSASWMWKREGKTTAWYPSMTIFRQEKPMDWDPVIKKVHETMYSCMEYIIESHKEPSHIVRPYAN